MIATKVSLAGLGAALAVGVAVLVPTDAEAFCGFYVSGGGAQLFNNATQVVLMRDGTRTVLSMQNNYKGPPQDFALVVPVPVELAKENVKTADDSSLGMTRTEVECTEWTNYALAVRFKAAAMGVPFLPARSMLGNDTFRHSAAKKIACPFTGEHLLAVPALKASAWCSF